jgi:hypothetical protein
MAVVGFLPTIYRDGGMTGSWPGVLSAVVGAANAIGSITTAALMKRGLPARALLVPAFALMATTSLLAFAVDWQALRAGTTWQFLCVVAFSLTGGPCSSCCTAREAVRQDHRVLRRLPHRREQLFLRAGHRHLVVALLEAEVARQPAAAAGQFAGQARCRAQAAVGGVAEYRVLVAVGLADRGAVDAGWGPVGGEAFQGLGEGEDRAGQAGRAGVVGQQLGEVRAEGRRAARFQDDDGRVPGPGRVPDTSSRSSVRRITSRARSSWPVET